MVHIASDVSELRRLNKRFIHNFVTNDVGSHDAILHPRFFTIGSAGRRLDRAAYLDYWLTGFDPAVIIYWDMRDERIEQFGDIALLSATNKWVRRDKSGAGETTGMTSYTDTYVREGGRWLCVLAQLTPVAAEHFPSDQTIVVQYLKGVLQPQSRDAA